MCHRVLCTFTTWTVNSVHAQLDVVCPVFMCVICSHQPRPNSHHNMIMTRFTVHWIQPLQHTPTTRTTVLYVACRANAGSMMGQRKRWSIIEPALAHHWTCVGMGTTSIYNWSQAWIVRIIPILCGKNTWQPWTYVSPSMVFYPLI